MFIHERIKNERQEGTPQPGVHLGRRLVSRLDSLWTNVAGATQEHLIRCLNRSCNARMMYLVLYPQG